MDRCLHLFACSYRRDPSLTPFFSCCCLSNIHGNPSLPPSSYFLLSFVFSDIRVLCFFIYHLLSFLASSFLSYPSNPLLSPIYTTSPYLLTPFFSLLGARTTTTTTLAVPPLFLQSGNNELLNELNGDHSMVERFCNEELETKTRVI